MLSDILPQFEDIKNTLGAFTVLAESGVLDRLGGKIVLLGVPAEECLETDWRLGEIKSGRLRYLGGKPELMYRGAFDLLLAHKSRKKIGISGIV